MFQLFQLHHNVFYTYHTSTNKIPNDNRDQSICNQKEGNQQIDQSWACHLSPKWQGNLEMSRSKLCIYLENN